MHCAFKNACIISICSLKSPKCHSLAVVLKQPKVSLARCFKIIKNAARALFYTFYFSEVGKYDGANRCSRDRGP